MKYFKKIIGKKCYLSPICYDDAQAYTEWLNDLQVAMNMDIVDQQISLYREKDILENMIRKGEYIFGIIDMDTNKLIGNCGLHEINQKDQSCILGIFIGEKDYWNQGYGEEASTLILDYAFSVLNMHNVSLKVFEFNKRAVRCYEKCGFKIIGRKRESFFFAGKRFDEIYMDILAQEFKSPYIVNVMNHTEKTTKPSKLEIV